MTTEVMGDSSLQGSSALGADRLRAWRHELAEAPLATDDAAMIDELRLLEEIKAGAEARQARLAVAFDASQRSQTAAAGVPAGAQGRGVAEQIALARRVSPARGRQVLGLAKVLHAEMPHAMEAFRVGRLTEWRATILARETATLELEHRMLADKELAHDVDELEKLGDRQLAARAARLAARLDAASVAKRRAKAEADRCVTIRPAPDAMVYLTALLPVAEAVAIYATLKRAADHAMGTGQETSRGRAMADTLVARVLGRDEIAEGRTPIAVALNVIMPIDGLLDPESELHDAPAHLEDFGPIPAGLAREIVANALDAELKTWIRRLFTHPRSGALISMDSRQRLFPAGLQRFIQLRDQFCRTLWCGARIRHRDHVEDWADGGETTSVNGQGLCAQCNPAKSQRGWSARTVPKDDGVHEVVTTTPTGHSYHSTAPPLHPAA